jgi:hypothetical protein
MNPTTMQLEIAPILNPMHLLDGTLAMAVMHNTGLKPEISKHTDTGIDRNDLKNGFWTSRNRQNSS